MRILRILICCAGCLLAASALRAQPEVMAWGNLTGFRLEGQLLRFGTRYLMVSPRSGDTLFTGKELQRPRYRREGPLQITDTRLGAWQIRQTVQADGMDRAAVQAELTALQDSAPALWWQWLLPKADFDRYDVQLTDAAGQIIPQPPGSGWMGLTGGMASGVAVSSASRAVSVRFGAPMQVELRRPADTTLILDLRIRLSAGAADSGMQAGSRFQLEIAGQTDRRPLHLILNPAQPGRAFDGLGGNFRIQNPPADSVVIEYCLRNLRVAWGRVELPWQHWHPDEAVDPLAEARAGRLHPRVRMAMEMAQRLHQQGIPLMIAIWFPPQWAVEGPVRRQRAPGDPWGNALNPQKTEAIYASITAYLRFLREAYGAEIAQFSFNESDLGIDVRQTPEEHRSLIRGLGAYMEANGFNTKLLLGDNSDANTYRFIEPALRDPEAHRYIGAVSFHSWRGWSYDTLSNWARAAEQLGVPLVVGEGSIDAAAWQYPDIFAEQSYALEEIGLYVRILRICQPQTILQWQLTSDYSPLAGGGIYGKRDTALYPLRRFWQLRQLSATPPGFVSVPAAGDTAFVEAAALMRPDGREAVLHLVNHGGVRQTQISGIPPKVKRLRVVVTDAARSMEQTGWLKVRKGSTGLELPAASFVTLFPKSWNAESAIP